MRSSVLSKSGYPSSFPAKSLFMLSLLLFLIFRPEGPCSILPYFYGRVNNVIPRELYLKYRLAFGRLSLSFVI
jgi:hypothetical protein